MQCDGVVARAACGGLRRWAPTLAACAQWQLHASPAPGARMLRRFRWVGAQGSAHVAMGLSCTGGGYCRLGGMVPVKLGDDFLGVVINYLTFLQAKCFSLKPGHIGCLVGSFY